MGRVNRQGKCFSTARSVRTFNRFMCTVKTQEAEYQSSSAADNKTTLVILISKGFDPANWELFKFLEHWQSKLPAVPVGIIFTSREVAHKGTLATIRKLPQEWLHASQMDVSASLPHLQNCALHNASYWRSKPYLQVQCKEFLKHAVFES